MLLNSNEAIVLTFILFIAIAIVHELLHMVMAHRLGYKTKLSPRFVLKIVPYAIAVELYKNGKMLKGEWKSLDKKTQHEYNLIAIAPYFFVIPFCVILLLTNDIILGLISSGILLWHAINLPLEWIVG